MSQPVIQTHDLTFYYGRQRGVLNLNLTVEAGEVYGFLGPNGAGKTTTLRLLLDILHPTRGSATIFGLDCTRQGVQVRQRVGYLPGELHFYPQLRGRDYLTRLALLRPGQVDVEYRRQLCARLDLDISRRIQEYSRGNKQKLGLVAAMMHRPDLLILDEPTSGLDPLVQQTVLHLVREARTEGRTVFFSSHVLSEVQAVCDRVGIIREGELIAVERISDLVGRGFRRIHLTFAEAPPATLFERDGVQVVRRNGAQVVVELVRDPAGFWQAAAPYGILDLETENLSLEDVFLSYYGQQLTPSPSAT